VTIVSWVETEGQFVVITHEESPAAEVLGTESAVEGQSSAGCEADGSEETWTLKNLTPRRLELRGRSDALYVLPAYGCRSMTHDPYTEFVDLPREEGCGEIEVTKGPTGTPIDYSLLSLWVFILPIAIGAGSALGASAGTHALSQIGARPLHLGGIGDIAAEPGCLQNACTRSGSLTPSRVGARRSQVIGLGRSGRAHRPLEVPGCRA
jgi:hypothetical protein